MGNIFDQVPDDVRGRAGRNDAPVSGLQDHAEPDPDFVQRLYEGAGLGVHPVASLVPGNDEKRRQRWRGYAAGYEGAANAGYRGATNFEDAEDEGARQVRRVTDEA
ncbi:hypothetical protein [Nocardia carnea]|uniref:hypothetical protein n=1 Tax=Nocardia carnea TaxID=37328 RepID=UPI0024541C8B|nr:hypothetical protein [Nocardia carnea]